MSWVPLWRLSQRIQGKLIRVIMMIAKTQGAVFVRRPSEVWAKPSLRHDGA